MEILIFPKRILGRLPLSEQAQIHLNCFLSVLFICMIVPLLSAIPHVCLARWLFSLPCPGCGITHSLIAMMHLQPREAWQANPAGIPLAIFLILQLCLRPIALCSVAAGTRIILASRLGERFVLSALFAAWFARVIH
jgi:hypothetical protein